MDFETRFFKNVGPGVFKSLTRLGLNYFKTPKNHGTYKIKTFQQKFFPIQNYFFPIQNYFTWYSKSKTKNSYLDKTKFA